MTTRIYLEKLAFWMLISLVFLCGFGIGSVAHATESVDQYLDRMRMRRDSLQYQACLERQRVSISDSDKSNAVSACVPPDYSTEQEAWKSGEWKGTEV